MNAIPIPTAPGTAATVPQAGDALKAMPGPMGPQAGMMIKVAPGGMGGESRADFVASEPAFQGPTPEQIKAYEKLAADNQDIYDKSQVTPALQAALRKDFEEKEEYHGIPTVRPNPIELFKISLPGKTPGATEAKS